MVSFHAKRYTGKDSRKLNQYYADIEAAAILTKFMNDTKTNAGKEVLMMDYFAIAHETGLFKETIKRILDHNGYGANGATW